MSTITATPYPNIAPRPAHTADDWHHWNNEYRSSPRSLGIRVG
jgi:hypothetical protein